MNQLVTVVGGWQQKAYMLPSRWKTVTEDKVDSVRALLEGKIPSDHLLYSDQQITRALLANTDKLGDTVQRTAKSMHKSYEWFVKHQIMERMKSGQMEKDRTYYKNKGTTSPIQMDVAFHTTEDNNVVSVIYLHIDVLERLSKVLEDEAKSQRLCDFMTANRFRGMRILHENSEKAHEFKGSTSLVDGSTLGFEWLSDIPQLLLFVKKMCENLASDYDYQSVRKVIIFNCSDTITTVFPMVKPFLGREISNAMTVSPDFPKEIFDYCPFEKMPKKLQEVAMASPAYAAIYGAPAKDEREEKGDSATKEDERLPELVI